MNRKIWTLVVLTVILSVGHHVDHALRHHAGWPVESQVTPFTYFLGIYVAIAIGTILSHRGTVGPGFWAILAAIGFLGITLTHFGSVAEDPPSLFASAYGIQVKGTIALIWLGLFELALATDFMYCGYRWTVLRKQTRASELAR